jgi:hypothetical protein
MMRKAFHLFAEAVRVECFDGLYEAGMKSPTPHLQEAPIGHLVSQGVLEPVYELGEEAGLIKELSRLEMPEALVE